MIRLSEPGETPFPTAAPARYAYAWLSAVQAEAIGLFNHHQILSSALPGASGLGGLSGAATIR